MKPEQISSEFAVCMTLIPREDVEQWIDEQAYADDAASAVAYTLRALQSGEPQEATWAARRAYEAADHYVMHRLGFENEVEILSHAIVQAELTRQRRDLDELRWSQLNSEELFPRLRDRANSEARMFFDVNYAKTVAS